MQTLARKKLLANGGHDEDTGNQRQPARGWQLICPCALAIDGARSAGHDVERIFLDEYVDRMLGNCRHCRRVEDGRCLLDDRYEELLIDHMLPADGIIFAMPLYFYGMPGG